MSDLAKAAEWLNDKGPAAGLAMAAATDLITNFREAHAGSGKAPRIMFTRDPVADRRLLDAVGLAEIAGRHGITTDDVMEAFGILLDISGALVAVL